MKKITLIKLTTIAATLIMTAQVHARSGGIVGRSGNPAQDSKDCWGCHAKPSGAYVPAYTAETLLTGPEAFTVRPGSLNDISVQLTTDAPFAGFNLSATSGTFIDLTDISAQDPNVQIIDNEGTHNFRGDVVESNVSWSLRWQAPDVAGEATVYVCVNPVDGVGTAGDGAPLADACINQVVTVVAGENAAPVATADSDVELDQNTITDIDVLSNDSDDVQLLASTLEIEQVPANGVVEVNLVNGLVQYRPNAGYSGVDSFSYTIADGEGARSEAAQVDLTIILTSGAPIIFDSEYDTFAGAPLSIDVLSAVNENSAIEFTADNIEITRINNASVTIETDGSLSYLADDGFKGVDSFTYVINADDGAVSNEAIVYITVTEKLTTGGGSFGGLIIALMTLLGGYRKSKQIKK